ncbi:MAG: sulfotransferase domain-containing protein [Chitinophagales bacterium]
MSLKTLKIKTIIANIPIVGRSIFPFRNDDSPYHRKGYIHKHNVSYQNNKGNSNAKIAVIGLPKSGNTWLTGLFADYFDLPVVHYNADRNKKGVTMFHRSFSRKMYMRRDIISVAYIVRDIRDVLVSYYNYSKTDDYRKYVDPNAYYENIEDFYYSYFLSRLIYQYDWYNHTEEYISHGVPIVKYEDLWDDTSMTLRNLLMKMNVPVDEDKIKKAVDNNTIAKSKKAGKQLWRKISTSHFRKGGYGGYKEDLPESIIEDINERFSPFLKRWGYV